MFPLKTAQVFLNKLNDVVERNLKLRSSQMKKLRLFCKYDDMMMWLHASLDCHGLQIRFYAFLPTNLHERTSHTQWQLEIALYYCSQAQKFVPLHRHHNILTLKLVVKIEKLNAVRQ